MNKKMRGGKSSELIVAGELIRRGLDVYTPSVDDQDIDMIIRVEGDKGIRFYELQIKSSKGYNRIIGVKPTDKKKGKYFLILHYRHDKKEDEFFYLTQQQVTKYLMTDSSWGDLIFNKSEREELKHQNLNHFAETLIKIALN